MQKRTCTVSSKEFTITEDDLKFYEKMGVPVPTLCPEERMRRRRAPYLERGVEHRRPAFRPRIATSVAFGAGGPDAELFDETLKTLIHEDCRNIVVSLERVKWVNSTGLGILISGYTTLRKSGGELKLLKVSDRIESIFIVSKLFTVFESFENEVEAVQSFS